MKKVMTGIFAMLILMLALPMAAQNIPTDPNVRIGTLKNGMKYYIRHNKKPENKVDMQLAINAGSILEDDDQQGLAHFMEHMNFNGTKHFPDNQLVDFLQSIGVKFGQHLNAYTAFDQTVYMLPVPLDKPENLDNGLKVMEDWAFNALLSGEQIDKERGVVLEELRLGLGPDKRMMDKYFPKLLYKSQYAERLPIGKKHLLETFTYDKIRRFHHDWYRPNLMAIMVVGDIDVDEIEQKIIKNFSPYTNPENERERIDFDMPVHKETLVSVVSDPDASMSQVQVFYKNPQKAKAPLTVEEYNEDLLKVVYSTMMDNRISELVNSNNPPFTYGTVAYGGVGIRPLEALVGVAIPASGEQLSALQVLVREIERARRFGFTQGELERARKQILSDYEQQYNNRDKTQSSTYVYEYINNFLEQQPMPGITWEYEHFKSFAPTIELAAINDLAKHLVRDENRVVIITGPEEKDKTPISEAEVLAALDAKNYMDITPYEEKADISTLIAQKPKAGKIVKSENDDTLGLTTITLSNGVKVSYKQTDFKDDELLFKAVSLGGSSTLDDQTYVNTFFAFEGLTEAGIMGYDKAALQKYLSDKKVSVNFSMGSLYTSLGGQSSVKDIPTLFELIYAYFTGLNKDADAFNAFKQKQRNMYSHMMANPQVFFSNQLNKFVHQNNARTTNIIPMEEDWQRIDYNKAYSIYKEKFADADNFHFYFVGNFNEKELLSLCETYLASLPATKGAESFKDVGYRPIAGVQKKVIKKGKDPKSLVILFYHGETAYNAKEDLALQALGEIATIKVIEKLREEESGIYGGGANGAMSKTPYGNYRFSIQFPCGPKNVESLIQNANDEMQKLVDNGPEQKDLDKYKKGAINDLKTNLKTNNYWLKFFVGDYLNHIDEHGILKEEAAIEALTLEEVHAAAKKYIKGNNITAILMPEDGWEAAAKAAVPAQAKESTVDAQTVINNYIEALGGEAKLKSVNTIYTKSKMKMMGMEFEALTKMMAPYKLYSEQTVMGQKMIQMFDGEKGYIQQGPNKMDMPAEAVAEMKGKQLFEAIMLKDLEVNEVQEVNIDGKDCYLLISNKSKNYFDKATGLLYKTEAENMSVITSEYMEVEGIKYPKVMSQQMQGQEITTEVIELKFNEGVSEEDFNI